MTDAERLERLDQILAGQARLLHQMNLLLTAMENVRVLAAVRDEQGTVVGLEAHVMPPMLEGGVR